jgi:hypothetical protein
MISNMYLITSSWCIDVRGCLAHGYPVDGKGYPFFSGCHPFGLKTKGDEDNHILSIFAWKSWLSSSGEICWMRAATSGSPR